MSTTTYRDILAIREVRRVLALSLIIRIPLWAGNVVLTLHVVSHLHRSYAAAGLLVGATTIALAISSPWRRRRLDQVGLRRAIVPSLVVLTACWSIAPFVSYWPLLALSSLAGLFVVPSFSIVRQALMHAVPEERRKAVLSIDSVAVEISFMIGPVLGVLVATYLSTPVALLGCELAAVLGGVLLWLVNPTLRSAEAQAAAERDAGQSGVRSWLNPTAATVLVASLAATIVLTGTDVGIVAALRDMQHQSWIGGMLAVWGLGSAVGALVYGAMRRTVPVPLLLTLLSAATIPVAFAHEPVTVAALLFVAGFFCAPTVTATVDALSRSVPERARGEALGWHGSAMTTGSAVGAPLAGVAIDSFGWQGGFVAAGVVGLVAVGLGALASHRTPAAVADEMPGHQLAGAVATGP